MDAAQRREEIRKILGRSREPVSAATIASEVHVSRQIVVGDIALLRAGGADIQATPRGYILQTQDEKAADGLTYTIACRHSRENLAEELYAVVDNGGRLLDVIVEHPVYGRCFYGEIGGEQCFDSVRHYRQGPPAYHCLSLGRGLSSDFVRSGRKGHPFPEIAFT